MLTSISYYFQENPRILILYLSLLGTVMLQNSAAFHNLLQRCSIEVDQKVRMYSSYSAFDQIFDEY